MKKLSLLIALILALQVVTFADEAVTASTTTTTATSTVTTTLEARTPITYDKAVELLLENNEELKTIQSKIEIQDIIIKEVDNESSRLKDLIFENEDRINERATYVYVDPVVARNTLNELKRSLDDRTFDLKQDTLDYYVKCVNQKNNISFLESSLKVAQDEYDQKSLELKVGKIISNDLRSYELAVQTAQNSLDNAKRDFDLMVTDFNYLITNELSQAYIPNTDNLESVMVPQYTDLNAIDLERIKTANLEHDSKLLSLNENVAKYEQQKKVERLDPSTVSAYDNYNSNIEDNDFEITKRTKEIKYQVNIDYNNLKNLFLDIKIMKNKISIIENSLQNVKLTQENGMATKLDVVKVEQSLTGAQNDLTNSLNAFYKAYQAFVRYY